MREVKNKYCDLIFLIILFIAFYLLNRFSPFIADDYAYKFFYDESLGELKTISSLKDALAAQSHDYMTHNGRFIVHTLTSYFCGKLGIEWFRIMNSLIFVLLVYGVLRLVRKELGERKIDKYVIAFILFLFMPCPGMILLGSIAMCINYLWSACAIIYFVILFNSVSQNNKTYNAVGNIVIFFISLLVGSLQESFSLGISAALFFYCCFHFRQLNITILGIVIGFWIGTLIVTFAPGNFVRLGEVNNTEGGLGLSKLFSHLSQVIFNAKLFMILTLLLLVLLMRNKSRFMTFILDNAFYFLTILFCVAVSLVVFSGERQVTCIELFSLILLIKLCFECFVSFIDRYSKQINALLMVLFFLFYIPIYNNRIFAYNMLDSLYKKPVIENTIVFPEYWEHIRKLNGSYWGSRFTQKLDFSEKWMYPAFSNYLSDGKDCGLVTAVLNESKNEIITNFKRKNINGCYHNAQYKYFVVRTSKETPITEFKEYYKPSSFLGKVKRFVLNKKNVNRRATQVSSYFDDGLFRYYLLNERSYKVLHISID